MITDPLIDYIKSQLDKNVSKDLIIEDLLKVGWHKEDITEAFEKVSSNEKQVSRAEDLKAQENNIKKPLEENDISRIDNNYPFGNKQDKSTDPYHEPIESNDKNLDYKNLNKNQSTQNLINDVKKTKPEVGVQNSKKIWIPKAVKPTNDIELSEKEPEKISGLEPNHTKDNKIE